MADDGAGTGTGQPANCGPCLGLSGATRSRQDSGQGKYRKWSESVMHEILLEG
jgi:hypothetical protein